MLNIFKRFKKEKKQVIKIDLTTSSQDSKHIVKHNYYNDSECKQHAVIDLFNYTNIGCIDMNFFAINKGVYDARNN